MLPVLIFARGAAWGEPIADDFYLLRHALLAGPASWFDAGGILVYWRPLSRQAYYGALGSLILGQPGVVAALHALALALTAVVLYRAFRVHLPGHAAAAIATFPVLAEASRMLVVWPSHFQDLGALLFAAIALHEMARRRLVTALVALLGSLLCKEVAAATALLLPWMPPAAADDAPTRRKRIAWTAAIAAGVLIWAGVYALILAQGEAALMREFQPQTLTSMPARAVWAWKNSLRAAFSLGPQRGAWDAAALAAVAALAAAGALRLARTWRHGAQRRRATWVLWGTAWFFLAGATLTEVYPDWWPNRALFGTLGAGVAMVTLAEAAHPAAVAALVALRLGLLASSPGATVAVGTQPPGGEVFDFARLTRLQRLVRDTREALQGRFPRLPHGARVGWINMPHLTGYAFAGDRGLQCWYRDTTLAWVASSDYLAHRERPVVFAAYQSRLTPQVALIETEALDAYYHGVDLLNAQQAEEAFHWLDRADSLQGDRRAEVLSGALLSARAMGNYQMKRFDEAARLAAQSLIQWGENAQAHFLIGYAALARGDLVRARAAADSGQAIEANNPLIRELRTRIRAAEGGRGP